MRESHHRFRRLMPVVLAAGAAVVSGGFGQAASAAGSGVSIVDYAFSPTSVNITAGSAVTWTNTGQAQHTVTSDTGAFTGSAALAPGSKFMVTFSTPGTFAYHCSIHPTMHGTVVVQSVSTTTTPPTTSRPPTTAPTTAPPATAPPTTVAGTPSGSTAPPGPTTTITSGTSTGSQVAGTSTQTSQATEPTRTLPRTGSSGAPTLAIVGLCLLAAGAIGGLVFRRRRSA